MAKQKHMTNSEYARQAKLETKCPVRSCGSTMVEGNSFNADGNKIYLEMSCTDCGSLWEEIYQLIGYDYLVDNKE